MGDREGERDKEREREGEIDRDTEGDREGERETKKEREREAVQSGVMSPEGMCSAQCAPPMGLGAGHMEGEEPVSHPPALKPAQVRSRLGGMRRARVRPGG